MAETSNRTVSLTPDLVWRHALLLANDQGLERLTMRKLAGQMQVAPMSLYVYFSSKDELYDRMTDHAIDMLELPGATGSSWQGSIVAAMGAFRRLLLRNPAVVEVLARRRVLTCSVGIARLVERILESLQVADFDEDDAVETFRLAITFTLGYVTYERRRLPDDTDGPDHQQVTKDLREIATDRGFDLVHRSADKIARASYRDNFELGLTALLDGLDARYHRDDQPG